MKTHYSVIALLVCSMTSCNNFSQKQNDVHPDTITQPPTGVLSKADSARMELEIKYNDGLARLDSLNGERIYWEHKYPAEASAIDSVKQSIRLEFQKESLDSNRTNLLLDAFNKNINDLILHIKQEKKQ